MEPNGDQPKAPEPKPDAKGELKSLPLPEIRNWKWGATNPGNPA